MGTGKSKRILEEDTKEFWKVKAEKLETRLKEVRSDYAFARTNFVGIIKGKNQQIQELERRLGLITGRKWWQKKKKELLMTS